MKPLPTLNSLAIMTLVDWGPRAYRHDAPNYMRFALPYVEAMTELYSMSDHYGLDDAEDIVLRFLCNIEGWKGETAKIVRAGLKQHLKEKSG